MRYFKMILAAAALCTAAMANAQSQAATDSTATRLMARNCLTTAPAQVLPLLAPQTRGDMLSYYDAGRDTPSENEFGEECRITALDDDCVTMVTGNGITSQIFVLNPTAKNQVIGIIETIDTPIPNSRVSFYNTKWQSLGNSLSVDPSLADWLPRKSRAEITEIQREVPFVLASMQFDPATSSIVVTNNMQAYYIPSDTPQALSLLKPALTYKWTGKTFRLQK